MLGPLGNDALQVHHCEELRAAAGVHVLMTWSDMSCIIMQTPTELKSGQVQFPLGQEDLSIGRLVLPLRIPLVMAACIGLSISSARTVIRAYVSSPTTPMF